MNVKIKLIDKTLPLPKYQTSGAVAFDLYSRMDLIIPPKSIYRIPTNVIIEVPTGYMLYIKDRSSTAMKKGLLATAGIIDQDFCGPNDEILFQVYNTKDENVEIQKGERIAQAIFIKIEKVNLIEVEEMNNKNRGGFGTTG